jgi:hypothetical protein
MVLAGLFLLCLLALHFVLNYQLDRVIGRSLRALVDFRSNSVYRLTYTKIHINLLRNRLEIRNLRIAGDTARFKQRKGHNLIKNSLFDIRIPQVEIRGLNLWKIVFDEKLEVKNIYLRNPQVKLLDYPNEKKREERLKINNLYHFFSDYLHLFSIENLEISNASFAAAHPQNINKQVYKIDSISLIAKQIKIDSINQPKYSNKPFEVANIELEIKRNSIQLPDNQLEISIGGFKISTQKAYSKVEHLHIKNQQLEIKIPQLRLNSIDIHNLYFSKNLKINKLWIKNPYLKLKNIPTEKQKSLISDTPQWRIYALISKYLASLNIEHILVEKGNFDLNLKKILPFKNITLLLSHFYLDSATEQHRSKQFFVDNIRGKIENYELLLPDSLHFAKISELNFSTSQSQINAKNLSIDLVKNKESIRLPSQDIFQLQLPHIQLKSENLWKNLLTKSLNFEELKIESPHIQIFRKDTTVQIGTLHLPSRLPMLELKKISVQNAEIHYHQWKKVDYQHSLDKIFYSPSFSAQVYNLKLNEEKYFDHLVVNAQNANMYLPQIQQFIKIDNFSFSSLAQNLQVENLQSYTQQNASTAITTFAGNLTSLRLENFDIHLLYRAGKLKAEKLIIQRPNLALTTYLDSVVLGSNHNNFFKGIDIQEVILNNGKINWQKKYFRGLRPTLVVDNFSAKLKNIFLYADEQTKPKSIKRLEQKRVLNWGMEDAELSLQNYVFTFPDDSHTVKIGKVDFNYARAIAILKNVSLTPKISRRARKNIFQAEIPLIELKVKDLNNFFQDKSWVVENLKVRKPEIDVYLIQPNPKSTADHTTLTNVVDDDDLKLADLFAKMPFNKLSINELEIDSSIIMFTFKQTNFKTHHLALENLSLQLHHFEIDSAKHHFDQLFDLAHINLKVGQYRHILPDNIHQVTARSIGLFSTDSSLTVHELAIRPLRKLGIPYSIEVQQKSNMINIYTPKLYFQGWNLYNFLNSKKLHLNKAVIETPLFNLQIYRPDSTKKLKDVTQKLRADSLYQIIAPFVKDLKINDLQLNNGNLTLLTSRQDKTNTFTLDSISIHAQKFDIHPINYDLLLDNEQDKVLPAPFIFDPTPYHFLNTENIVLTIKNYAFQLPDKVHTLQAKSIKLSTRDSTLTADNVEFRPNLGKIEFSKKQTHKVAWLYPQIEKLTVNQFDFYSLLYHEELEMRSLVMDKVKFEIYRDRGLPNRTDYFPKMPQELLRELPFLVRVDSIKLRNANIIYEEQLPNRERAGRLTFENSDALLMGVTNDPTLLKNPDFQTIMNFNTSIMGQGKLTMGAKFLLNDPKELHYLYGEIGEMDMLAFNEMLEYVFPVRIKSGFIHAGKFDLRLNYKNARGRMFLKYNDLKVEVINRKFASFMANSFVVTNHNPSGRFAPLRVGEIKSTRNLSRAIFSYWGYSILNGFKTSIGLRGKKQQKKSKLDKNKKVKNKKLKLRKQKQTPPTL